MASSPTPLNFNELAPAAIEAAVRIVEAIDKINYTSKNPFKIAGWQAVNVGNIAMTILQTMRVRDENGASQSPPAQQALAGENSPTGGAAKTPDEKIAEAVSYSMVSDGVPPCTTPGY